VLVPFIYGTCLTLLILNRWCQNRTEVNMTVMTVERKEENAELRTWNGVKDGITSFGLSWVVKSHQLSLFGHVARMNELLTPIKLCLHICQITGENPPGRPRSTWIWNVCNDLSSFGIELPEARDAAQNRPFWQMLTKRSGARSYWMDMLVHRFR